MLSSAVTLLPYICIRKHKTVCAPYFPFWVQNVELVHVPKCAGAAFFALLNRTVRAQLAAGWHGSWALYPSSFYSHNAPGCLATHPWGGTHCGFAETEACLAQGYARGAGGVPMSPHTPRLYMTVLREPVEVRPRRALRPHPQMGAPSPELAGPRVGAAHRLRVLLVARGRDQPGARRTPPV